MEVMNVDMRLDILIKSSVHSSYLLHIPNTVLRQRRGKAYQRSIGPCDGRTAEAVNAKL